MVPLNKKLASFIKIIRPVNALLASIGVFLGFQITNVSSPLYHLLLLLIAAICVVGFGNIINDIKDINSDKINHPHRPIPSGEVSSNQALIFAIILVIFSFITGRVVSEYHFYGVLIPNIILLVYALFLKGTPFLGNIIISLLVAYTLIFGAINSSNLFVLYIPALLAFLLNLSREIIKDIQDKKGDMTNGIFTTATISEKKLKIVLIHLGLLYLIFIYLPFILKHFNSTYFIICTFLVLPLHLYWLFFLTIKDKMKNHSRISLVIKIEMISGLTALFFDKFF